MSDLKLKKELFSLTNIFQSVNAFSEIADISVSEEADVYNCKFCACVYDEDEGDIVPFLILKKVLSPIL